MTFLIEDNLADVKNFYLEDPGNAGVWQDGEGEGVSTRYIIFEKEGAAFNYGWENNVLIMTTSYSAFKKIVKRL